MAKLKIKYESIDPYYSDIIQTFIGEDIFSCWDQELMFKEWLGRNHSNGISSIYNVKIIEEKE